VIIPPEEIDRDLPAKLRAEAEGVLRWAVEGAVQWYRQGLGKPGTVESAGRQWRSDMDHLGRFIEDCCITGEDARGKARVLYSAYRKWADESGERPSAEIVFSRAMAERGFPKKRTNTGAMYSGIGLVVDASEK